MTGSPIIVFASFFPKVDTESEVEAILRGMIGPTRQEAGCEIYDLYQGKNGGEGPSSFHLFERYRDEDSLHAHRETEHYKAYRAKIQDYLSKPIGVYVLEALDAVTEP